MSIPEIATIILAISTAAYATLTYLLLREQRREKKKPVLEEMLEVIILPLLNYVQEEIRPLRQKRFGWNHNSKEMIHQKLISEKSGAEIIVYENFSKAYPSIPILLRDHDISLSNLKNSLKNLGDRLLSIGFKERCIELINEYNQGAKRATLSESDVVRLLKFVIDNYKELAKENITHEFWKANGAKLLSFRSEEEVKELIDTVENNTKKILDICKKIEGTLLRLISQFSDKYGIEIAKHLAVTEGV